MAGFDAHDVTHDAQASAETMGQLQRHPEALKIALHAYRSADGERFRAVLDEVGVSDHCRLVIGWFCSKTCTIRCLQLAGPPHGDDHPDIKEFAAVVARLGSDPEILAKLVEVIESGDAQDYRALLKDVDAVRFAHLLCRWVCGVRCQFVVTVVCGDGELHHRALVEELSLAARAIRELASSPDLLDGATEAVLQHDCELLQGIIAEAGLARHCRRICWWLSSWRCVRVCLLLGRRFLDVDVDVSDDEIFEFANVTSRLAEQPDVLERFVAAVVEVDEDAFVDLVRQFDLGRFALQLCHWLCWLHWRRFCLCVCPPLIARIDEPADTSCATTSQVTACSASDPFPGIEITGTAAGGGFDHYSLRYRWGAGSWIDTAVVYPDCSRPPATTQHGAAVVGGTLGWLDVTLLPVGVAQFTVRLDVHDSASGTVTDSVAFEVSTEAIDISHVATVEVSSATDPFHPGATIRLIVNPADTTRELSVGGKITVDGSAYTIGCDRILAQFDLARFAAPPSSPVPTPVDASGAADIMAHIPYLDTPDHPWQSGCWPAITPNTILNGNLVAEWGQVPCPPGGPRAKVHGTTWNTAGINARVVVLLEVRDRPVGGPHPGSVAGTAQVAVWVDNEDPTAEIHKIGGISGCGDLLLSDYVGTTADIEGVAWDPPIDPTAPQEAPNDNFGSYGLTFKKNGETHTPTIAASTPGLRVPNTWPTPGASGLLAAWDVVAAIDHAGPLPAPPGKLARGERCAYVITLSVEDETHVGDSGSHHRAQASYAVNIINDL